MTEPPAVRTDVNIEVDLVITEWVELRDRNEGLLEGFTSTLRALQPCYHVYNHAQSPFFDDSHHFTLDMESFLSANVVC